MSGDEQEAEALKPPYFAVSLLKLSLMSVCTLGLYHLWWFYINWCRIKHREQSNIAPAWRAFFAPIWAYSCFARIRTSANASNIQVFLPAGPLAVAWFITINLWRLPDPYWLVCYLSFVWMLPVQMAANQINLAVGHRPDAGFSGWDTAILIIGGLFALLAAVGTIFPPAP